MPRLKWYPNKFILKLFEAYMGKVEIYLLMEPALWKSPPLINERIIYDNPQQKKANNEEIKSFLFLLKNDFIVKNNG